MAVPVFLMIALAIHMASTLTEGGEILLDLRYAETRDSGVGCCGSDPSYAVDGVKSDINLPWDQCLQWTSVASPWWGVDLGTQRTVTRVKLYNRNDCCPDRLYDVNIYLGDNFDSYSANALVASGISVPQHAPLEVLINSDGRYLFVARPGKTGLTLCEIEVRAGPASYYEVPLDLRDAETRDSGSGCCGSDPSYAVDGVTSDINLGWNQCLQWTSVTNPYWGVDLGVRRSVTKVKLYNRNDCCPDRLSQVNIYLGDDFDSYMANPKVAHEITVPQHSPLEVIINRSGRYLFVARPGHTGLTLCEIQVWIGPGGTELPVDLRTAETRDSGVGCCGSDPSKAVDGLATDVNFNWDQCLQWTSVANPWWGVDIRADRTVTRVKLFNRNDCCPDRLQNVNIYLGNNFDSYSANALVASGISVPQHAPLEVVINRSGRYLFVARPGYTGLTLCEIQVYVAPAGPEVPMDLTSAETRDSGSGCCGSDPSYAVNGVTSDINLGWNQCLQWTSVANPWWGVDLGAQRTVTRVKLYNRNDCCPDRLYHVNIYLGNDFDSYMANPKVAHEISVPQHAPLEVTINRSGRYLFVARPGYTGLTLCEIQVWIA